MSESNNNKSLAPSDVAKTDASKSGWLLKWTNYLKGGLHIAINTSSGPHDFSLFRLSKTMVRAVQWCLVVLSVSLLLTSNFFSWTSCSSVSYIVVSGDSWCGLCNYFDSYLSSFRLTSNIFFSMVHTNTLTNCPMLKRQIWLLHLTHFIIATTFNIGLTRFAHCIFMSLNLCCCHRLSVAAPIACALPIHLAFFCSHETGGARWNENLSTNQVLS